MSFTVLLIDYDPRSIARIRRLLGPAGCRLVVAVDGPSGLDKFHRCRPDLTLVQDLVPKLHGFDVCRQIKGTEDGATTPVIILSSYRNHRSLLGTNCNAYIEKPFEDEELLDVVRELLPGAPAATAPDSRIPMDLSETEISKRLDEVLLFRGKGPA